MTDWSELTQAFGELEGDEINRILNDFIRKEPSEEVALEVVAACQEGMVIVSDKYEKGKFAVGDLIFAGELLTEAIGTLKSIFGSEGLKNIYINFETIYCKLGCEKRKKYILHEHLSIKYHYLKYLKTSWEQ